MSSRTTLKRLIYICPAAGSPSGGLKVIFDQIGIINTALGGKITASAYFPDSDDTEVPWYPGPVNIKPDDSFNRDTDFAVIPELYAGIYGRMLADIGLRYGVLVQGGFLILGSSGATIQQLDDTREGLARADLVLSIGGPSTDVVTLLAPTAAQRLLEVSCSVDATLFRPAPQKQNAITYMPRKLAHHAAMVDYALRNQLPAGWQLQPILGLDHKGVAAALGRSRIFLSFSELEGLGLPPIEAALCGNAVIGYTGEGGKAYFAPPLFTEIQNGDILGYAKAVVAEARRQDAEGPESTAQRLAPAIAALSDRYSRAREIESVQRFVAHVATLFERKRSR